jgi:hypothetical protein
LFHVAVGCAWSKVSATTKVNKERARVRGDVKQDVFITGWL